MSAHPTDPAESGEVKHYATKSYAASRLRMFLVLIAAANLLCGAIWTKVSYDLSGLFSAGFNIGLVLLLCGAAAIRSLLFVRTLVRPDTSAPLVSERADASAPADAEAPQPPARA